MKFHKTLLNTAVLPETDLIPHFCLLFKYGLWKLKVGFEKNFIFHNLVFVSLSLAIFQQYLPCRRHIFSGLAVHRGWTQWKFLQCTRFWQNSAQFWGRAPTFSSQKLNPCSTRNRFHGVTSTKEWINQDYLSIQHWCVKKWKNCKF